MSVIAIPQIIKSMVDALVADPARRVSGPTSKYRCKATYSLYPHLQVSPIVSDTVNSLCESVETFKRDHSVFFHRHPQFFFEVMGKENRVGDLIVKLVLINEWLPREKGERPKSCFCNSPSAKKTKVESLTEEQLEEQPKSIWEEWISSEEPEKLLNFLLQRHPSLVAVVAHVDIIPAQGRRKPTKSSNYVSLTHDKSSKIREVTTNGKVYSLSVDSFCEVNQYMESKIFEYICSILDLNCAPEMDVKRALFLSGRDILAMFKSLESFYDTTECVTTCPSVFRDAEENGMSFCTELAEKNNVCTFLRSFCESNSHKIKHAILTSGRHGLHPSTSVELVNLAEEGALTDLIYISCNIDSLARDFHIFKEGFRMHSAQVFDFFPETLYVMTVVHWKPYALEALKGSLLTLPIGPPGSGKSTIGKKILEVLQVENPHIKVNKGIRSTSNVLVLNERIASDTSVPRSFLNVETTFKISVIERDVLFKSFKEQGCSLHVSKTKTHESLLDALAQGGSDRSILYLDSTNGSEDARKLYKGKWIEPSVPSPCSLFGPHSLINNSDPEIPGCLELLFVCKDVETLLKRVQGRGYHPSFPDELEKQEKKICNIIAALQVNGDGKSPLEGLCFTQMLNPQISSSFCAIKNCNNTTKNETVGISLFIILSHLYLSSSLAISLYKQNAYRSL